MRDIRANSLLFDIIFLQILYFLHSHVVPIPCSVFYVFYEQYRTIRYESAVHLSTGLLAVAIITWIMLGLDVVATLNVVVGVTSILLSVIAMMVLWDIPLNAISLVNLVVVSQPLAFKVKVYW